MIKNQQKPTDKLKTTSMYVGGVYAIVRVLTHFNPSLVDIQGELVMVLNMILVAGKLILEKYFKK